MRTLLEPATVLAMTPDHPACVCVYPALADKMECDTVTADERFPEKATSTAGIAHVFPLAQFERCAGSLVLAGPAAAI